MLEQFLPALCVSLASLSIVENVRVVTLLHLVGCWLQSAGTAGAEDRVRVSLGKRDVAQHPASTFRRSTCGSLLAFALLLLELSCRQTVYFGQLCKSVCLCLNAYSILWRNTLLAI